MKHRISAGMIVENEGRILLVRYYKAGVYDFWVAPGGGAEDDEDLRDTARREVFEECGLRVEPLCLAYIEDLADTHTRACKLWFTGRLVSGSITTSSPEAVKEGILEAKWLTPEEFAGKTVYPPMLHSDYWQDKETGFAFPRYVGLRTAIRRCPTLRNQEEYRCP